MSDANLAQQTAFVHLCRLLMRAGLFDENIYPTFYEVGGACFVELPVTRSYCLVNSITSELVCFPKKAQTSENCVFPNFNLWFKLGLILVA